MKKIMEYLLFPFQLTVFLFVEGLKVHGRERAKKDLLTYQEKLGIFVAHELRDYGTNWKVVEEKYWLQYPRFENDRYIFKLEMLGLGEGANYTLIDKETKNKSKFKFLIEMDQRPGKRNRILNLSIRGI